MDRPEVALAGPEHHGYDVHLTYANVVATLALVLVLGGGAAYAANTVFSSDIVNGEVKTADLANNAVRTGKIANGQVQSSDLGAGAVAGHIVQATETSDSAAGAAKR